MSREKQLEKLVVELEAKTATYKKRLDSANKKTRSFGRSSKKSLSMTKVGMASVTAAATAMAASFTAVYTKGAQAADQLGKMADKIGETPEKLKALQYHSELSGVSVNTTNMALQRMTRRTSEAAKGTGEAVKALKELNIDAKSLAKLSPADQFKLISDQMAKVGNQGDKVRLAMKLFDSEGVALVNTMKGGAQAISNAEKELDSFNIQLSRSEISKIEAANDSFHKVKTVTEGIASKIAAQFAPAVEMLGNEFLNAAKEAGGAGGIASKAFDFIAVAAGTVANAIHYLKLGFKTLATAIQGLGVGAIKSFGTIIKGYTELANLLPGVNVDYKSTFFGRLEADAMAGLERTKAELMKMANMDLPSSKVGQFFANVKSQSGDSSASPRSLPTVGGSLGGNDKEQKDQDKLRTFKDLMAEYQEVSDNASAHIENAFVNAFDNISNNISQTLATAIIEGESMRDAFSSAAKTLATELIAGLIKIGAQLLMNAIMAKTALATTTAASTASATTVAAAWAPAAAMTSLASFGGNSVPAMAGISATTALTSGLALTGMAHDGISTVPREGTWLLDKGERVLSSQQNADLSSFLSKQNNNQEQQGPAKVINMNIQGVFSSNDVRNLLERINEEAGDMLHIRSLAV